MLLTPSARFPDGAIQTIDGVGGELIYSLFGGAELVRRFDGGVMALGLPELLLIRCRYARTARNHILTWHQE